MEGVVKHEIEVWDVIEPFMGGSGEWTMMARRDDGRERERSLRVRARIKKKKWCRVQTWRIYPRRENERR
jgi:hypothetical protein